jgi:potassium/hydrogen antiporter
VTNTAILAVSFLLVLAYLLDVLGRRTRLPPVVLLIVTGIVGRQVMDRFGLHLGWVDPLVPIIGTLGLILIVLEGALDLSLRRERLSLIARASFVMFTGFVACVAGFTVLFEQALGLAFVPAALAAMSIAVISSAVAIPSVAGLPETTREFVVYESSLSDIVGVLVFYAWLESAGHAGAFAQALFGGMALSLVAAVVAGIGILFLINRLEGHVRFLPLLAGLTLLYALGKEVHLSPLVLILVCGLLLNNTHLLAPVRRLRPLMRPGYDATLRDFKGLVVELTFAVKSFFFLMLGYWTDLSAMTDWRAWAVMVAALGFIYPVRYGLLRLAGQTDAARLVWVAPRGLITVLLFLTAATTAGLEAFPFGAIMLLVLVTAALTAFSQHSAESPASAAEQVASMAALEPLVQVAEPSTQPADKSV